MFKDELYTRVRARRDSDDDDIGLPHSPCTSPTTVDVLTQGLKEKSTKSQTTCSAGSLISMGSSENDDDSAAQLSSGHSSRMSLLDRRSIDSEGDVDLCQSVPLNHNAAHHKIAVRPKRKYGLPQRRLKQLAASAMSTLPSTPELIEDNGKTVSKLETVEVLESTTVSVKSTEVASSSISQSEVFDLEKSESAVSYKIASSKHERQVFQLKQESAAANCVLECKNEALKCDAGELSVIRHFSHLTSNLTNSSLSSEVQVHDNGEESLSKASIKEKCDNVQKSSDALHVSCSTSITNNALEASKVSESISTSKDAFESGQEFVLREKSSQKSDVTALRVSALIKNLEKSESLCVHDNVNVMETEREAQILVSGAIDASEVKVCDKRALDSEFVLNSESLICKESHIEIESLKNNLHLITQKGTSPLSEFSKLNSSNVADKIVKNLENVNVMTESSSSDTFVASSSKTAALTSCSFDSEWQQMHQLHAVVTEKQSNFLVMPSISTEEESIMSEKNVSVSVSESRPKLEEGKIFVSHNKAKESSNQSSEDDKKNLGEHITTNIPSFQSSNSKRKTEEDEDQKQFVSSIDICADTLKSPISEMTVHSLISQITSCKSNEDKITISVNAEESKVTSNETHQASCEQYDEYKKLHGAEIVFKSDSSSISSSTSSCTNVELEGKTKSSPQDNVSASKASKMQKRVSVEIVPFSQRVKERKYQPVIYSREEVSDTAKSKSNAVIERKLSDRKISSGQSTSQVKGSNRHSFSGVISETNKKENELKNKPQLAKGEKPSGPVHIHIHKDKSNITTPSKSHAQKISSSSFSDKLQQLETPKQLKPHLISQEKSDLRSKKSLEMGASETSTKQWEVKIHPAAKLKTESSSSQGKMENKKECVAFLDEQKSPHDKSEEMKQKLDETFSSVVNKKTPEDEENAQNLMSQGILKGGRENPSPTEMEPELFRVFARRSVKQRTFEKPNSKNTGEIKTTEISSSDDSCDVVEKLEDSHRIINVSDNSTVIKISEQLGCCEKSPDIVKKKSKSFSEKEKLEKQKTTQASSLQATSLSRRQMHSSVETTAPVQETVHRRQRLASVPDIPVILPPSPVDMTLTTTSQQNGTCKENDSPVANKSECLHRTSSLSIPASAVSANGSSTSGVIESLKVKDSADILSKDSPTPQWLQLAQQRRELREQRERLLLGSSTNSFVLESSGKPSRSSKVWDMVNNFQKLQMT